jgi:hypothetical protein
LVNPMKQLGIRLSFPNATVKSLVIRVNGLNQHFLSALQFELSAFTQDY